MAWTNEQRVRATLKTVAKMRGERGAARAAVLAAVEIAGRHHALAVLCETKGEDGLRRSHGLMGAREVAAALGVNNPNNVGKVKDLPAPVARVSGGLIPVWLGSDVVEFAAERTRKRRAAAQAGFGSER